MKKILLVSLLLVLLFVLRAEADMYMFGYTPGGALGGGLRFDVGEGKVVDLSATGGSGPSGSTYSLYADYFVGLWGLGITVKKAAATSGNIELDITPQLALERPINDTMFVGILVALANYDTTGSADPRITFFPTIVPYFVLTL